MARFNLVFHGMMLFWEDGPNIRVLIPPVPEHDYKFGSPLGISGGGCNISSLQTLPSGDWTLSGPAKSQTPLSKMIAANDHLILKQSKVTLIDTPARTIIEAPKPAIIRPYRAVEPNVDIFNGTPTDIAVAVPPVLYDAIAFVYKAPAGTQLQIGDWFSSMLVEPGMTLCIYAQTADPNHPDDPHHTAINDLLLIKSTSQPPTFRLSRVGKSDGPPLPEPATVIDLCQLKNLVELTTNLHTDLTGCMGGFGCNC